MQGSDGVADLKDESLHTPKVYGSGPPKNIPQKEMIVFQASFFRGDLLKFRGVYTSFSAVEDDTSGVSIGYVWTVFIALLLF